MTPATTNDAETLALHALAAALANQRLADRFLSLSGIDAPELRRNAANPRLLAAFLAFLEANEADLIEVAERIGAAPEAVVSARKALEP